MSDDYYIAARGETKGPYSKAQLKSMWNRGLITSDTQYWREGMDDWHLVETLVEGQEGLQLSPTKGQQLHVTQAVPAPSGLPAARKHLVPVPKMDTQGRRQNKVGLICIVSAAVVVGILSYTPLGDNPGILHNNRQLINACLSRFSSGDSHTIAWMMTYWDENASHDLFPKEDALRLAKACLQYDRDPKQRFVEMIAWAQESAYMVKWAFDSYDPDTQRSADPEQAAKLMLLMTQRDDVPNANFLERVIRQQKP